MGRFRSDVLHWFDAGRIAPGREEEVLRAAGMMPSTADWRAFLGQLTLWLGVVALANAVIFFFAFNWDDLGRFAKFGLVEGTIVAGLVAFWFADLGRPAGKALLLLLALLAGALLALTGQVYQTGADTYELFAWWALLILPWVLVGRFSPLWLFWLALIDTAAFLYFQLFREAGPLLWGLFAINTIALLLWEAAHRRGVAWLSDSWPPRLIAVASAVWATALAVWAIVGDSEGSAMRLLAVLAYGAWVAATWAWYQRVRPDLFMLAGGLLSLIVAVVALLAKNMPDIGSAGHLFIGLVVIGMSAGGALWLKSVQKEQQA